ncbi:MAG TPA: hypothetical protein VGG68_07440 [Caulobacteraceae bacterium]|jgi:hypothetical protein
MNEQLYFNPHWIPDPAVWRLLESIDQKAAARAQIAFYRDVTAAQTKALEAAAKIAGER